MINCAKRCRTRARSTPGALYLLTEVVGADRLLFEVKNWVPVAGAMADLDYKLNVVDYVPCYRSEAGTGNAMGFVYWRACRSLNLVVPAQADL